LPEKILEHVNADFYFKILFIFYQVLNIFNAPNIHCVVRKRDVKEVLSGVYINVEPRLKFRREDVA
jgi:hypothetical protein